MVIPTKIGLCEEDRQRLDTLFISKMQNKDLEKDFYQEPRSEGLQNHLRVFESWVFDRGFKWNTAGVFTNLTP